MVYQSIYLCFLSFILAIGIITDDSVIMTDAIYRRIENGESPLVAAYKGSRQITFAIIATTSNFSSSIFTS